MSVQDIRTLTVERSTSTAHRLLYYDGACGNVHGHNFDWEIEAIVRMDESDDSNMPVDFKDISDLVDTTDHATLMNKDDPLVEDRADWRWEEGGEHDGVSWTHYTGGPLGDVVVFDSDPTCEMVVQWMAGLLVEEVSAIRNAHVEVSETDKYTMASSSRE